MVEQSTSRISPTSILLKFPVGANNRLPEYAVPEGSARLLDNLDVTNAGSLISRRGARRVASGEWSSLFAHPAGFLLAVNNGALVVLRGGVTTTLTTVTGLVVYAMLDGVVYWSDGITIGRVTSNGELTPWGLATPPGVVCSTAASGGLSAGDYAVTITAVHSSGIESGAPEPVILSVPEGGGISVTAPIASGYTFKVYATPVFGESVELRRIGTLGSGATATFGPLDLRERLETLFASKPPAGSALVAYKGRLWIADGTVLWFTSERSPNWVFKGSAFFQFESSINMLGVTADGVYVGLLDRVYFLQGSDPRSMTRTLVSSVGALLGGGRQLNMSLFANEVSQAEQCAWVDSDGFPCIGKPGGVIIRPTEKAYVIGSGTRAVCCSRQTAGIRQVVSLVISDDPIVSNLAATDVPVSSINTHGVVI